MTTIAYQVFKETALPGTLTPHSVYYVAPSGQPNHVEIYVTDATGTATRRVITAADVQAQIQSSLSGLNELVIVANIAARDALLPLTAAKWVYVADATADSTVTAGGASYLFNPTGSVWLKTGEGESMDVTLNWGGIVGRPSSSPALIDDAVSKAHTHANLTQLNKVSEDGAGNMTYNGSLPSTGWTSTAW